MDKEENQENNISLSNLPSHLKLSNSWTFVNEESEEAEKKNFVSQHHRHHHEEEESDGISVISENEIKNHNINNFNNNVESENNNDTDEEMKSKIETKNSNRNETSNSCNEEEVEHQTHQTNNANSTDNQQEARSTNSEHEHENTTDDDDEMCNNQRSTRNELSSCIKSSAALADFNRIEFPSYLLLGAVMIVAFAIMVSFINGLKSDVDIMKDRIGFLEEENQFMKNKLIELTEQQPQHQKMKTKKFDEKLEILKVNSAQKQFPKEDEEKIFPPKTKTVFNGDSEESLKIIDKQHQLPDFCYFTDESDLFYEYNQELCDRLLVQLSEKKTKKEPKNKKDKKMKRKFAIDDDDEFIDKKLKTMDEEIETIKNKRNAADKKRKNYKNSKDKNKNWMDERAKYREQSRESHEKDNNNDDVNWFLKRKVEREFDRMD